MASEDPANRAAPDGAAKPDSSRVSGVRGLGLRFFGEPPPKGAPRSESLRWVRGFYVKPSPLTLAAYILVLVWDPQTWVLVASSLAAAAWLLGLTSINIQIRRARRTERA